MKLVMSVVAVAMILGCAAVGRAQEPELVSEIVARINNDIITRADYLGAVEEFKSELTRQMRERGKSQGEIDAEFAKLKPTVLDILIDDILLEQKAKELGIDVEAEVNQQFLDIAKQQGFKNVLEFESALKQQGIDPDTARASLRKRFQQQYVVQREVLQPIFINVRDKERREYYDKNVDSFTVPGEVTLSEILLPLEGYTATEVEQRAKRLVAELRAGVSFLEAVSKNSPVTRASRTQNGLLGSFKPGELKEDIAKAIGDLKPGEVTEPIRIQEGYQIIRVDDRKPPVVRKFEEPEVQNFINRSITMERADEGRKKYLKKLREEAFIKITKGYEPEVTKS